MRKKLYPKIPTKCTRKKMTDFFKGNTSFKQTFFLCQALMPFWNLDEKAHKFIHGMVMVSYCF